MCQGLRDRLREARNLGHPERHALPGGDICLLRRAEIGERVGGFAGVQVKRPRRSAFSRDLLFRVEHENSGRADRKPRYRAQSKSRRT